MITELNQRSRDIFRHIVDAYVETGEPVGSRTISRKLGLTLSPAWATRERDQVKLDTPKPAPMP